MINVLVYLLAILLVFGVVVYVIRLLSLPPPFDVIAQLVIALIMVLILMDVLLGGRYLGLRPL